MHEYLETNYTRWIYLDTHSTSRVKHLCPCVYS